MRRIAVVGCCKKKMDRAAEARFLYESILFRLSKQYAEIYCDEWIILSAAHGVVLPHQTIAPYDTSLKTMPIDEVREWAAECRQALREKYCPDKEARDSTTFILLAGARYGLALQGFLYEDPLAGMGIGRRLSYLRGEIRSADRL